MLSICSLHIPTTGMTITTTSTDQERDGNVNRLEESNSEETRGGIKSEKNNMQSTLVLGLVGYTVAGVKIKG